MSQSEKRTTGEENTKTLIRALANLNQKEGYSIVQTCVHDPTIHDYVFVYISLLPHQCFIVCNIIYYYYLINVSMFVTFHYTILCGFFDL